jgi:hypothetical protein
MENGKLKPVFNKLMFGMEKFKKNSFIGVLKKNGKHLGRNKLD